MQEQRRQSPGDNSNESGNSIAQPALYLEVAERLRQRIFLA
jgi:hypothetical protein